MKSDLAKEFEQNLIFKTRRLEDFLYCTASLKTKCEISADTQYPSYGITVRQEQLVKDSLLHHINQKVSGDIRKAIFELIHYINLNSTDLIIYSINREPFLYSIINKLQEISDSLIITKE